MEKLKKYKIKIEGDDKLISDIRFISRFLYYLKVVSSISESEKYKNFIYKLTKLLKENNNRTIEINKDQLNILYKKYKEEIKLLKRISYPFFIKSEPKIYIEKIQKGSLELIIIIPIKISYKILALPFIFIGYQLLDKKTNKESKFIIQVEEIEENKKNKKNS